MKCYIAICTTLEIRAAPKLVESVRALINRLILDEHVHCSLLSINEEVQLISRFHEKVDDERIKSEIDKVAFGGKSDLNSLAEWFNPLNNIVEDGICFIFCDRYQYFPQNFELPTDYAFAVFYNLSTFPIFRNDQGWNSFDSPVDYKSVDEFVNDISTVVKSVKALVLEFSFDYFFGVSLFPRMSQKMLFDDPERMYPKNQKKRSVNFGSTGLMKLVGFIPNAVVNGLTGRACTYFLKPAPSEGDKESYFTLSKYLYTNQKVVLLKRNAGDHFLMRCYRPIGGEPEKLYLLLEYTTSSSLKFVRKGSKTPRNDVSYRKHVFSYDSHTSFATKECMELALNRINRMIKREADEAVIKKELLLATRHMAVSCHNVLATGISAIIQNHISTVPKDLVTFYKTIQKILSAQEGCKMVALYLEKLVPNSRTKVDLY